MSVGAVVVVPVVLVVLVARAMTCASTPPSLTTTSIPLSTPSADLLALCQDYWQWKTQEFPQFSTQLGLNDDTAARLDSYDKQRLEQRKVKCEKFLQRANQIEAASLSPEDLITLKVFKEEINTYVQNFPYKKYYAPVTFMSGPQESLRYLVEKEVVLDSYNDYQKLLSRYADFPRQAKEVLTLLRENIKDNIMPSNWSMVGVVDRFDSLTGPVEDSVFYKPFVNMSDTITSEQRTTLRQQAQERIKQDLIPSFKEIRNFIVDQYLLATRTEVGVSSLPGGKPYYQACLKFHTTTDLTPQEIHDMGQKEVARIEKEVHKTAAEIGMNGKTFSEISQALKNDPVQNFTSKNDLLDTFRNAVYNDIYPRVKQMFPRLPQTNVTVEGDDNPDAMLAMYTDPPTDGSRPGRFTINTHSFDALKKYEVMALSLHETYPGHHLEATYARQIPSNHTFRKYVDFTSDLNAPARFPLRTAITEGWGLYSEFLGEELGLYTDPYQMMGRHSFELLRASRLVVDTGMHALGWSRDRAVAFLQDHTAFSEKNIQGEINRYITYPGQACAYKVGEIKIKELRRMAEEAVNATFQLSDFHDVVLGCLASLKVVEECVRNYIVSATLTAT
ncbi:uncharacterized protein LOC123515490 isoform X2 [Portunus trituberculatus]|uniref:uncharacterized protein LOC123515490 isoform X2 n=1 Tax=Portunus trituberculatus TaxID=210409 RepID=UPI001E1D18C6|nr:uncharacterized protein LOC123515490 isoform X2 [Portunus trituberculatus]